MHARGRNWQLAANNSSSTTKSSKSKPKTASILPMLDKFHDIIGGIHVPVDDGVDKLNRKYTLLVFLFLALPIFTKQYIGDPIECFAPVYFAEHQSRYINSYCWTQSTYYMVPVGDPDDDGDQQEPPDRIMPDEVDYFIGFETVTHIGNERLRRVRVSYYQWAPLILLVQGLCFYIPFLIWNSCANNAGVKLRRLLKKASDIASLPPGCQQREALLAEFVDQFHTLVTGEAGWCADLQCGTNGSLTGGSSASSSASGSSGANSRLNERDLPVSSQQGGRQNQRSNNQANNQSANNQVNNNNNNNNTQDHETEGGRHGNRGNHQMGGREHQSSNNGGGAGCCLVSIPIIGSLLAYCLKPCSSFGLVGPSKYLCLLYLAVKSAYVFNVGLQFFLLGQFLGRGYLRHGLELINRLIVNGDWWASPRFPLSTLCQVRADMSGGLRSYTCQCVLPINVFNEKIFSVVWFYMAFLMPLNVISLLFWIYRTFESNRLSYIRLCLWRTRLVELNQIHRTVRRLSQSYLGWDGVFLLRLIEHNHGSIMATLIMSRLWEFYANQMKLQEDANQLALANNAQHTLSNTTTAISNQHQLLAAAAAAAAAGNQIGPGPGGGGGGGGGGGHHGNSGHHGSHGPHSHGPPPPLMAAAAQQQQQQHGGAMHQMQSVPHFNPHGGSHGHTHNQHSGPFGQTNHGPSQMSSMVPHGPHAHHSGQINQAPGHHPLHAANTHHIAHHGPNAAAHHHLGANGPFASTMNANILAQLQQQHHVHGPPLNSGGSSGNNTVSVGQSHGAGAGTQQPASGNVAAAVAALAAAAAATNSTNQSAPGTVPTTNSGNQVNSSVVSSTNSGTSQGFQESGNNPVSSNATHPNGPTTSTAPNGGPTSHHPIHLHSLMQATSNNNNSSSSASTVNNASQQTVGNLQTSGSSSQQQQQQQQQSGTLSVSSTSGQQQATSNSGGSSAGSSATANVASSSLNSGGSHTTTTSFITASAANAANAAAQPGSGPPLPPPPPAHVVAAVAAASSSSLTSGVAPLTISGSVSAAQQSAAGATPGMATARGPVAVLGRPPAGASQGFQNLGANQQQQQVATSAQQQQSALPPHTNPNLFNLKSSSIQAAANGTRYSPHTIKR